jgi:ABC-type branched-subunit amino acid transport system substrate-binding protein
VPAVGVAVAITLVAACGSSSKKSTGAGAGTGTSTTAASKYAPIPPGPIVVGVSVPLSGATAAFGTVYKQAYETVTSKTFNAAHPDGIDGHPVEFRILDDGGDVTKAVGVANQFVSEKVAMVATVSANPAAQPQQLAILGKAKIPVISQFGQDDFADTSKWPYIFAVGTNDKLSGEALAQYIAKHPEYKKLAVLTDGSPADTEMQSDMQNALKTLAPSASVVKSVTITPGAVDVSTAVAQVKDANPDFLLVFVGFGYGPIWQAIRTSGWAPKIFVPAGAFYDGYSGMGPLADSTVVVTTHCAKPGHPPFPKVLTDPMDGYAGVFGTTSINYILFVTTDNGPVELLKRAVEKNHSIDPDAIKNGMETLGPVKLFDTIDYNFSATNHFGLTGDYGTAICNASGFIDGNYRIPVIAS